MRRKKRFCCGGRRIRKYVFKAYNDYNLLD
jgi:hypothetical protein